jgi:hypothetical protein
MNVEFDRLNALKAAWGALQPLTPENEARLWKKFRLLRNYHSNHIEATRSPMAKPNCFSCATKPSVIMAIVTISK